MITLGKVWTEKLFSEESASLPLEKTITDEKIPGWIKNNAKWWAEGLISEDDFVKGIEYLVKIGIIKIWFTSDFV